MAAPDPLEDPTPQPARLGLLLALPFTCVLVSFAFTPWVLAVAYLAKRFSFSQGALYAAAGGTLALLVAAFPLAFGRVRRMRARSLTAARWLILGVLPFWGLSYSHFLGEPLCQSRQNAIETTTFRAFAEPELCGLVAFHLLTVLAYALSRRRAESLRPATEAWVHATLIAGIVVQAFVAIHVARWLPAGLLLAPVFLPCLTPLFTIALYVEELRTRLRRRGLEAMPSLAPALFRAPVILGVHAVMNALWLGRADGALRVFTRTCGYGLSTVPIEILPGGHYLCTVAARGHPWLVKPERIGVRRGTRIVVNRQLAIANAFEDLLHERWPRGGRVARRIYDRLAWPVSHHLRRAWLADLTYLAMKPAEWGFALALLLCDREDPERRISRMYR